jgi:kinetochore protein NDC80
MSMIPRVGRENPIPQTPASSLNSNRRKTLGGHQTVATYDVQRSQVNRRQSIGKPLPRNTASENPRQSIGHNSAIAATSNRRKSVGAILKGSVENRRQSFGVPATNIVAKQDTRLVNDKAFQRECIQKIFNYLVNNGYNHPISQKAISRPSGRDFSLIVTFMLRKEDPCFQTGNMKFEDEVAMQFKALGYPFPVSKTALVAAGSPHTWPALLAALSWLVDFCNSLKVDSVHDDDDEDAIEYLEALQQRTDQNFLKYLGAAYVAFLRSDVQASDQLETELTAHFEKGNYLVEREFEQLTDINASICEEVEIIKNQENE